MCTAAGDTERAIEYGRQALQLAQTRGDTEGEGACYFLLGSIMSESVDFGLAEPQLQRSMKIRRQLRDKVGLAETLNQVRWCAHTTLRA